MDKRRIAGQTACLLAADRRVQAVLLVGSLARGIESVDSDIDLVVICEGSAPARPKAEFAGTKVGIEWYGVDKCGSPSPQACDLRVLRNVGRLQTCLVLFSRWQHLGDLLGACHQCVLQPDDAIELLAITGLSLQRVVRSRSLCHEDRVWLAQSASEALSKLALSLSFPRFQKPKWVMHDLESTDREELLQATSALFGCKMQDAGRCAELIEQCENQLAAACALSAPLLTTEAAGPSLEHAYVLSTLGDARSLLVSGDLKGSVYTAIAALRLMNGLLGRSDLLCPESDRLRWRRSCVAATMHRAAMGRSTLTDLAAQLAHCRTDLAREYEDAYRRFATRRST